MSFQQQEAEGFGCCRDQSHDPPEEENAPTYTSPTPTPHLHLHHRALQHCRIDIQYSAHAVGICAFVSEQPAALAIKTQHWEDPILTGPYPFPYVFVW